MKLTIADKIRIQNAFNAKCKEYNELTLDQLKELFPTLGGSYKRACIEVANVKLRELREANLKELIDSNQSSIEEVQIIEDNTTVETESNETSS